MAVIIALILIGSVPQKFERHATGISLQAIREGIRFIVSKPIIFSSMILDFIATFFASANTLMPFVANDVLHVSVVAYGWLSAAQSVGAVLAATVISQVHQLRQTRSALSWGGVHIRIGNGCFWRGHFLCGGVDRFGSYGRGRWSQHHYSQYDSPVANAG